MIPRREPFEVLYRLNCDNLCADFSEDIEFRFSFGITSMIQRFTGKGKIAPWVISNYTESVISGKSIFILLHFLFVIMILNISDSTSHGESTWSTRAAYSTSEWRLVCAFTNRHSLCHLSRNNGRTVGCRICKRIFLTTRKCLTPFSKLLCWYSTADENCRLAIDLCFRSYLWWPLPLRKTYLDKQSQGARFQKTVRWSRHPETTSHSRFNISQLQSSSSTVSFFL